MLSLPGRPPEQGSTDLLDKWLTDRQGAIWLDLGHVESARERELLLHGAIVIIASGCKFLSVYITNLMYGWLFVCVSRQSAR
ncbi:MAG: hypothetical protein U5P41_10710 [Gammaproteobacteria bacterium]|nr:hypothetical protein [Gammaproteobacteria bacterium]